MKHPALLLTVAFAVPFLLVPPNAAEDRSEAEYCAGCHFNPNMGFVADKWLESEHANSWAGFNGNTYCAKCHSPMQADPDATSEFNDPVPFGEWEAVTCGACHPPHSLRVAWGTPIGLYDIEANVDPTVPDEGYTPLSLEESNRLCESCHEGYRHAKDFQGFGAVMFEKKAVRCVDCHMAIIPAAVADRPAAAHDFQVAANLPWSCGTFEGGCHANKTEEWAAKQINKEKIHGKNKTH